jgi:hypothetical protein
MDAIRILRKKHQEELPDEDKDEHGGLDGNEQGNQHENGNKPESSNRPESSNNHENGVRHKDANKHNDQIKANEGKHHDAHIYHSEWCFTALVLGVFGLILPLFSALAIVFGIGGLMQVHRLQIKGKWMAITGIVLGFLAIIMLIVAIIFGITMLESYLMRFGGLESLIGRLN